MMVSGGAISLTVASGGAAAMGGGAAAGTATGTGGGSSAGGMVSGAVIGAVMGVVAGAVVGVVTAPLPRSSIIRRSGLDKTEAVATTASFKSSTTRVMPGAVSATRMRLTNGSVRSSV